MYRSEPLEEVGLNVGEMNFFMISCMDTSNEMTSSIMRYRRESITSIAISESNTSQFNLKSGAFKLDNIKKDWIRFLAFTRLCLLQLVHSQ